MNTRSLRSAGSSSPRFLATYVLLLFAVFPVPPAAASVILNGDIDPVYLYRWSRSKDAFIGKTAGNSGSVTVNDGSQLESSDVYLGYEPGTTGSAMITGSGSIWSTGSHFNVGYEGSGELSIEAGAEVSNSSGYIGYDVGSSGEVTVRGPGSKWTNRGWISVGRYGTGTLTVEDGGTVTAAGLNASLEDLRGDGLITVNGAILDADLVFDGAHSTQATVPFGSGGTLTAC